MEQVAPRIRRHGLIVREIGGEVLIYDQQEDQAYCLTDVAAALWKHCDGETTLGEIRGLLAIELGKPVDDQVIYRALSDLGKDRLLEEEVAAPVPGTMSRRQMMARTGVAAAAMIPLITALQATPAGAQTCVDHNQPCQFNITNCCPAGNSRNLGLCCTSTAHPQTGDAGLCGVCSGNCCQLNSQCVPNQTCYG
jgi:hypothetical protein